MTNNLIDLEIRRDAKVGEPLLSFFIFFRGTQKVKQVKISLEVDLMGLEGGVFFDIFTIGIDPEACVIIKELTLAEGETLKEVNI